MNDERCPDFRPTPEYDHLVKEVNRCIQDLQSLTFWLQKAVCDADDIAVDREAEETENSRKRNPIGF